MCAGVKAVDAQALPAGYQPLLLRGGMLACLTAEGALADVLLSSHAPLKARSPPVLCLSYFSCRHTR